MSWLDWLRLNWVMLAVPLVVFLAAWMVLLRLRRLAMDSFLKWARSTRWHGDEAIISALSLPSMVWVLMLSIYLAETIAEVPDPWDTLFFHSLWSLFTASATIAAIDVINRLARFYGRAWDLPSEAVRITLSGIRILIVLVAFLTVLYIWGIPTTPLLLLIGVVVVAGVLIFQDIIPNMFAGVYLNTARYFKLGDYVKLSSGEEGYVTAVNLRNTQIKALDESTVIVPNRKLVTGTIINYGRPLKKASEPFRFLTRLYLTELTGLRAATLAEFRDALKRAENSIVFYHTHHFLLEYNFLLTQPTNDFGHWVTEMLGDQVLGERLASVDAFEFATVEALRDRLVNIIDEYMAATGENTRRVAPGDEFHFLKSVSVVLPTSYVAHDLREFVESLRKITFESLYFHIFESRLRLGKGQNDFSVWLGTALGDEELANAVARFDPYSYTLGALRSTVIQLLEKRIK